MKECNCYFEAYEIEIDELMRRAYRYIHESLSVFISSDKEM
jgi:hypothetical protein